MASMEPSRIRRGFTIVELMVALTIAGILLGLAVPNMRSFILNSRLVGDANDLLHSLNMARTEAIKRQLPAAGGGGVSPGVAVCSTASPLATANSALACSHGAFRDWFVFVDANGNGDHEANEEVLEHHGPVDNSLTVRSDNRGVITYSAAGFAYPDSGGQQPVRNVVICDLRGLGVQSPGMTFARTVRISQTGRAFVSHTTTDVSTALGAIGGSCP